jgi:peptide/nickel transport system permease protein
MAIQLDSIRPEERFASGRTAVPTSRPPRYRAARLIIRRVIGAFFSLCAVVVFNFFLFRVVSGDPARSAARNRHLSAEGVAHLREQWGLDKSKWEQFTTYVGHLLHGDLGTTFIGSQPVSSVIRDAFWPTILLVGTSTLLSTIIGTWIGIKGAWERGTLFDRVSNGTSLTLYAMPVFWLGIVLLMLFAGNQVGLGIFPTGGIADSNVDTSSPEGWVNVLQHLFLPCLTLTLAYLAQYSLIMRSSMLDEMGQEYLTTARAKGLRDAAVRQRHVVPNALLPAFTLIFLNFGFVISGAVTVEYVFSWHGLGWLTQDAVSALDYNLLQGLFLVFSASVILFNLIADLSLGLLDPRVREV